MQLDFTVRRPKLLGEQRPDLLIDKPTGLATIGARVDRSGCDAAGRGQAARAALLPEGDRGRRDAGGADCDGPRPGRFSLKLPEATSSFGAVESGGFPYVYGGHVRPTHNYYDEAVSGRFHRLNLATGAWQELAGRTAGPGNEPGGAWRRTTIRRRRLHDSIRRRVSGKRCRRCPWRDRRTTWWRSASSSS